MQDLALAVSTPSFRMRGMDRERFGRALGQGAREAAKAVMKAADAAASPDPKAVRARQQAGYSAGTAVRQGVVQASTDARTTSKGLKQGSKRFGEAVWGPFVRLSGQLWLELTGVFFGLFALSAGIGVWRERAGLRAGGEAAHKAWFAVVMLAVFGYFAISSFVRATRRSRR
jgi:hypothetical protein